MIYQFSASGFNTKGADPMTALQPAAGLERRIRRRLAAIGLSNHVTHDRIIAFDDARPDHTKGVILSHAELSRSSVAMVAAICYNDFYRRDVRSWRFRERIIGFMYFVDAAECADALGPGVRCASDAL